MNYNELLNTQQEFDELAQKIGVRINPSDRIHRAYTALRKVEQIRNDKQKLQDYLAKNNKDGHVLQSVLDLAEICEILPVMKKENPDIIKDKMQKILNGTLLRKDENINNQIARNTMFELVLLADLQQGGFNAHLGIINPDILATAQSGRTYEIECKRLYESHAAAVKKNIKNGFDQLNKSELRFKENTFGILALSVQRVLSRPDSYLQTTSPKSGLEFLSLEQKKFIDEHKRQWMNKNRARSHRNVAIIVHHSGGMFVEGENSFNKVTFATTVNVWPERPEYELFKIDFQQIRDSLNTYSTFT